MTDLVDFYRTQVTLLWKWRGGPIGLLKRLAITLVVATLSFTLTALILPGLSVASQAAAVGAVLLISLFNVLIRPVILAVIAPRSLILTGLAVLALQIGAFLVIAQWSPGVHVDGVVAATVASFVYAFINTILTAILGVDLGGTYFGFLVQALRAKGSPARRVDPGLVVIQIDGLAHPLLTARIRAGSMNTLAGWIRKGTHRLSRWEALLPTMTSASQLGILHGNNDGVPAFRWFERDRQQLMVSSVPADAAEMVRRASNGEGLLSNNGVSISNLVNGDATRSYLTSAGLTAGAKGLGDSRSFYPFFFSPSGYLRSLTLLLGELITERIQSVRAKRAGVVPRLDRGWRYAFKRAARNVLLRDVNISLIIEEMYRGANVIYADFVDYDDIAHHSGPERLEALKALDGVDAAIATLVKAAEDAPRPYRFVVLSDHGQSLGATFKQRYGQSLGDLVRELMHGQAVIAESVGRPEGSARVSAFLAEQARGLGLSAVLARGIAARASADGVHFLPASGAARAQSIVVVGSGNLGLVYFADSDHRLTLEELEARHPDLVTRLAQHPGIAMVLVASQSRGGIVFGPKGLRVLADGQVDEEDPLAPFGPHALAGLCREHAMKHAPDLLLISQYDPALGEVAAFEEQIGSHGGLGGAQSEPFILYPIEWTLDEPIPLGAPAIYRNLRRWIESVGITLGPARQNASGTASQQL